MIFPFVITIKDGYRQPLKDDQNRLKERKNGRLPEKERYDSQTFGKETELEREKLMWIPM